MMVLVHSYFVGRDCDGAAPPYVQFLEFHGTPMCAVTGRFMSTLAGSMSTWQFIHGLLQSTPDDIANVSEQLVNLNFLSLTEPEGLCIV